MRDQHRYGAMPSRNPAAPALDARTRCLGASASNARNPTFDNEPNRISTAMAIMNPKAARRSEVCSSSARTPNQSASRISVSAGQSVSRL